MSAPVILYLWSNEAPESTRILDELIQKRLTSLHGNSIIHQICIDNQTYRQIILKNAQGIKATVVPCFLVTIEKEGTKQTTVIDRTADMETFIQRLTRGTSSVQQ